MTAEIEYKDGRYLVTLDGHRIDNIKSVQIQMNRDEKPIITLSVYADKIHTSKTYHICQRHNGEICIQKESNMDRVGMHERR